MRESEEKAGRERRGIRVQVSDLQRRKRVGRERLRRSAELVLESLGIVEAECSIVLLSDRQIRKLNRDYLGKDRPTDVMAFSQTEGAGGRLHPGLLGDVVISVETAEREALARGGHLEAELDLLVVHGILHLLGYEHTRTQAEAGQMNRLQRSLFRRVQRRLSGG